MDREELRRQLELSHADGFTWALHCCDRDARTAEDVLQTAYLKVLDGRARFDGRAAFTTWLFAVIRRTAAEARRRHLIERLRLVPLNGREPLPEQTAQGLQDAERRSALALALGRLPRRQREVLLLVFYHGQTVDDAAGILGIGAGSARRHYARGKERLRELLARHEALE
jgi:RNA polymerase sigma-70 factor (ECF subfamily)